jgi:hypothetical protein
LFIGYIYQMMRDIIRDKLFRKKIYLAGTVLLCFLIYSTCALAGKRCEGRFVSSGYDTIGAYAHSLIPVHFKLEESGYVTLVIEDIAGIRVRNLISEIWYPKGNNVAWWDCKDDYSRDLAEINHGVYGVTGKFVKPGQYVVRGAVHQAINLHFEFSVYTTGNPPWSTDDHTGAWLANHTPPQAAQYLSSSLSPTGQPIVLLGCYVTEGPDGIAWVDLDGKKKGGKRWVGGLWTAAPFITDDKGTKRLAGVSAYVASIWESIRNSGLYELRINSLSPYKNNFEVKQLAKLLVGAFSKDEWADALRGMAVYDGIAVVSINKKDELLVIDLKTGDLITNIKIPSPRGCVFNAEGQLMILSGNQLLKFNSLAAAESKIGCQVIISGSLEDPYGIVLDREGAIYISDRGNFHTVKVFTAKGIFVKNIGQPGIPAAGLYNPRHMNNPAGITIDEKQQLWVTEQDFLPKRVSVWTLDGKLIKAFYGPPKYGGGGTIDQNDKKKFYYAEENKGAMEFDLNWQTGTSMLKQIYYRPNDKDLKLAKSAAPESAIYHNGQRYFTNSFNSNPTNGSNTVFLFAVHEGIAIPVAGMGRASDWEILKTKEFKRIWPTGVNLDKANNDALFIWQDTNADGKVQPEEVSLEGGIASGITIMPDFTFCVANFNNYAVSITPQKFSPQGIPIYDIKKLKILVNGVLSPASSGGNQALIDKNGWGVITLGVKPNSPLSITGMRNGQVKWTYPDLWPGLHASHHAPEIEKPGMLIGTTRTLGPIMDFKDQSIPSLWAVNGNHGNVYIFTNDGIFVSTLFKTTKQGVPWRMLSYHRDMSIDSISIGEEDFWPTIVKTSDEKVYIVDGARNAIVRIDGLESIRRLSNITLNVSVDNIIRLQQAQIQKNLPIKKRVDSILTISLSEKPPIVNDKIDDWLNTQWAKIDRNMRGALKISGGRLYAIYCTKDSTLLKNSGEMPLAPFKTGGALDLMIGALNVTDPDRINPVSGDCRIIVTIVKGKPLVLLYRPVVPGTDILSKVPFSSPSNTITFDRVDDISKQTQFVQSGGNYEISFPLALLGLNPINNMQIKGDIGILKGNGTQTISRTYWSNKAAGTTSDVPSEAMLAPNLWGTFIFKKLKD